MSILASYTDPAGVVYNLVDKLPFGTAITYGHVYTTVHEDPDNYTAECGPQDCSTCAYAGHPCSTLDGILTNPKFSTYFPDFYASNPELFV